MNFSFMAGGLWRLASGLAWCVFAVGAVASNVLENSSFEAGMDTWQGSISYALDGSLEVRRVDDAVHGKHVVEVGLPNQVMPTVMPYAKIQGPWIPMEPDVATLSVYARVIGGTATMTLGLKDTRAKEKFELTPEWKRYSMTVPLKLRQGAELPMLLIHGSGRVQIDAVQFEQGPMTTFVPRAVDGPEVGIFRGNTVSLLVPGEEMSVGFAIHEPDAAGRAAVREALWELVDRQTGGVVSSRRVPVAFDASGHFRFEETWTAPDLTGLYRWQVRIADEEEVRRWMDIGVLPKQADYTPGDFNSFAACVTIHSGFKENIEKARRMGISIVRAHGALPFYEYLTFDPENPVWRDEALVDAIHATGMSIYPYLGTHDRKDAWERLKDPKMMEKWRAYLEAHARHYRGRIQAYEIFNEPELHITRESYAPFEQASIEAIRAGDPDAIIVGVNPLHGGNKWLEGILDLNDGFAGDVISFHGYMGQPPEIGVPRIMQSVFGPGRSILKKHGLESVPLWDTESGYYGVEDYPSPRYAFGGPPFLYKSALDQARFNIRQHLLFLAEGVEHKALFILNSQFTGYPQHSVFGYDSNDSAKHAVVAHGVMTSILRDAQPRQLFADFGRKIYVHAFDPAGSADGSFWDRVLRALRLKDPVPAAIWVAWSFEGEQHVTFPGAPPLRVVDMFGRPVEVGVTGDGWSLDVSESPVYIFARSAGDPPGFVKYSTDKAIKSIQPTESVDWQKFASAPQIFPHVSLEAEEADFFDWTPGLTAAAGASGGKVVALDQSTASKNPRMLQFQFSLRPEDAGRYQIWAAVRPLLKPGSAQLEIQINGAPPVSIVGGDQIKTYKVKPAGSEKQDIGWEFCGSADFPPGLNEIRLLEIPAPGRPGLQMCDRIILHSSSRPQPKQ